MTTRSPIVCCGRSAGSRLIAGAELQGTIPLWDWIGDEGATTFSY